MVSKLSPPKFLSKKVQIFGFQKINNDMNLNLWELGMFDQANTRQIFWIYWSSATFGFYLSFQWYVLRAIYMLYILATKNKISLLQAIMDHYYNKLYFSVLPFFWIYFQKSLLKHSFYHINTHLKHIHIHTNVFRKTLKDSP